MEHDLKTAVIGGGSWATALVKMLCNNQTKVGWWMRDAEQIAYLKQNRHNPRYLRSIEFKTAKLRLSHNLEAVIDRHELLIFAIPSAFLKDALTGIDKTAFEGKVVFSAIKGIVPENNVIVGEFFHETYGVPYAHIGVITGPCHAEEIALEKLSYLTIACQNTEYATCVADNLNCSYLKATVSDDIYGTEYAAVLKNIFAIANGICRGLGYGDNFQAVLISNAIKEIKRFVDTVHPIDRDIKNSAYLGDLLATAYSQFSRNRNFGNMIGRGYTIKSAQVEMNMVAEGYYASKCVKEVNETHRVEMPISDAVYNILYKGASPRLEMQRLADGLW